MAFQRPTLQQLTDRIRSDLVSRLGLTGGVLRRSLVSVLATVIAGAVHMLYGFLDWTWRQSFPDTAEAASLRREASLYGLSPTAAGYAKGTATATGTNGTVVPAGTRLQRQADGAEFTVDADATVASGTATLAVTALVAGAAGTLVVGTPLTFESPVAGVSSTVTVASSTQNGSDQESNDGLLSRYKARLNLPPHGGNSADFVAWAKEVAGVTRAWCYPQELGAGTVTVRFVRDNDGTGGAIIPNAGAVAAVQAHIDAARPVTAATTVVAPVADTQNFTVHIVPDTAANRTAVTAQLADLLTQVAPGGTLKLSQVEVAVGTAAALTDFAVAAPGADVVYATGHLPVMGVVTWT